MTSRGPPRSTPAGMPAMPLTKAASRFTCRGQVAAGLSAGKLDQPRRPFRGRPAQGRARRRGRKSTASSSGSGTACRTTSGRSRAISLSFGSTGDGATASATSLGIGGTAVAPAALFLSRRHLQQDPRRQDRDRAQDLAPPRAGARRRATSLVYLDGNPEPEIDRRGRGRRQSTEPGSSPSAVGRRRSRQLRREDRRGRALRSGALRRRDRRACPGGPKIDHREHSRRLDESFLVQYSTGGSWGGRRRKLWKTSGYRKNPVSQIRPRMTAWREYDSPCSMCVAIAPPM